MNSNGKSSPPYDSRLEDQPSKSAVYSFSPTFDEGSLEGGLEVGRILDVVKRRLFVILGVTSVVIGLAVAWNRTRPPAYAGNFRILIEAVTAEEKISSKLSGQGAGGTQNLDSTQPSESKLDYPTQIQLLLSPKLLMPVVQKLKNTNPEITYEALKNSLVITRFKDPEITKILDVNYQAAVSREAEQVINLVAQAYIRYSVNERQTNVRRAVQFLDEQLPKVQSQVKSLEAALQNFRERNQLIDPGTLGTQIGSEISNAQQQMLETQIELTKTRQLYAALGQQLQMQPRSAEAASVLSDAPDYQQLVKELQNLDVDIQTQSSELTPNHPKVLALQEKRARLLPLIQQRAEAALGSNLARSIPNAQALPYQNELRQGLNKQFVDAAIQVQVLESKEKGLNTILQTLAVKSGQLPMLSRQYEDLQRRLKIASDQLSKFLQTREELMISAARQEVPWEIVASPTVQKVPSASLPRDLVLGTILGVLLGIGVALLLEAVTNVIYSLKDLRSELTLPILGTVPKQSSVEKMLPSYDEFMDFHASRYQFSPFIESFRSLNSQLRLLRPDVPIQSLVVSSSLPDEGKSTIATQLAQAAAAMGQRVLLVDADLRKPSLQLLVNPRQMEWTAGLTDVIAGTVPLTEAIQEMPGYENLHILFAGAVALDPTSILSSQKMRSLMQDCRGQFDLVIYDSPPLSFADALLLIAQTDGLLMVTQLGKIHRGVLRNAIQLLETSKVPVIGVVANMANDDQFATGSAYYRKSSEQAKVLAS